LNPISLHGPLYAGFVVFGRTVGGAA